MAPRSGSEAAFQQQVEQLLGASAAARFLSRVDVQADGCWLWTGGVMKTGYGRLVIGRRNQHTVHRIAFQAACGPLGEHHVHHRCGNKLCVRPEHLEALTASDHAREHNPRQTHCHRGHSLAEHGARRTASGDLVYCRACRREDYAALPPDVLETRRASARERARRAYERKRAAA